MQPEEIEATKQLEEYFQDFVYSLITKGEFDMTKESITINYLNSINTDNNFNINEVLKLIKK